MANGHSSEVDEDRLRPPSPMLRSESPLSDINDIPTTTISSVTGAEDADHSDDDAIHDMATSDIDDEEDAPGEEDADFDEETPPPEAANHLRQDSSSSEGSLRPGKRKNEMIDDEEYMKQNPELYGLRRSVCLSVQVDQAASLTPLP
jgi:chromodomain-helicase-DNA-binding protein 1